MVLIEELKERFGIQHFKDGQLGSINAAIDGKDVLSFMPTGYGKSVCYQIPALLGYGITLVVSPLISLMEDQVRELKQIGVSAMAIHAESDREHVHKMLSQSSTKLVYVSPERLSHPQFIEFIAQRKIQRLVIDEAHCISMWGDGFRPEYRRIDEFRAEIKKISGLHMPVSAFTATANHRVIKDIVKYTGINKTNTFYFKGKVVRENIKLSMRESDNKIKELINYLMTHLFEPVVIYSNTIKDVEKISAELAKRNISHNTFHSKLLPESKSSVLRDFMSSAVNIVVATSAFGMGINKSNIRHIIHMSMPENIEMYYQQVGRAGRDGAFSYATLFYDKKDRSLNRFMAQLSHPKFDKVLSIIISLKMMSVDGLVDVREDDLIKSSPLSLSLQELKGVIKLLKSKGMVIDFSDQHSDYIRLELKNINKKLDKVDVNNARERAFDSFDTMMSIAKSNLCRAFLIDDYFASKEIPYYQCGNCDNCKNTSDGIKIELDDSDVKALNNDAKKDILFTKEQMILNWIGYRKIYDGLSSFGLFSSLPFELVGKVFDSFVALGCFICIQDSYFSSPASFKNKLILEKIKHLSVLVNSKFKIVDSLEYQSIDDTRKLLAIERGCDPDSIIGHHKIIEFINDPNADINDISSLISDIR